MRHSAAMSSRSRKMRTPKPIQNQQTDSASDMTAISHTATYYRRSLAHGQIGGAETQRHKRGRTGTVRAAGQSATVVKGDGTTVVAPGNESGYTFDVDGAFQQSDMGQVKELKDRREILDEMIAAARESGTNWRFIARSERPDELLEPPPGVESLVRGLLEEIRPAVMENSSPAPRSTCRTGQEPACPWGRYRYRCRRPRGSDYGRMKPRCGSRLPAASTRAPSTGAATTRRSCGTRTGRST